MSRLWQKKVWKIKKPPGKALVVLVFCEKLKGLAAAFSL
jgi:hypothetical protein